MTVANSNQTRPALRLDFTDPERSDTNLNVGSSFGTTYTSALASTLADLDRTRTALINDAGYSEAAVDNMTANDMFYALKVYVDGGGAVAPPAGGALPTHVETTTSPTNEVRDFGTVWLNTTTQQVYQTSGDGTWVLLEDFA